MSRVACLQLCEPGYVLQDGLCATCAVGKLVVITTVGIIVLSLGTAALVALICLLALTKVGSETVMGQCHSGAAVLSTANWIVAAVWYCCLCSQPTSKIRSKWRRFRHISGLGTVKLRILISFFQVGHRKAALFCLQPAADFHAATAGIFGVCSGCRTLVVARQSELADTCGSRVLGR